MKYQLASFLLLAAAAGAPALADPGPVSPAIPGGWAPKAGDAIVFNVLRKGQPFGTHTVRFEPAPEGGLVARTIVNLKAGLGPVTLYRYDLDASEMWKAGELVGLAGKVNDDGKRGSVSAEIAGDDLTINGTAFKGKAPEGAVPASHWNYAQTKTGQLLSTEDGEIIDVKVTRKGRENVKAGGQTIAANRYGLDSDIDVDLWYDDFGRWVKLAFSARGQDIEYVLANTY